MIFQIWVDIKLENYISICCSAVSQAKMGRLSAGTSEIVESTEELNSELRINDLDGRHRWLKPGQNYSIEDDINQLFAAIDIRSSARVSHTSHQGSKDAFRKSAMKRPIRVYSPQSSGIGISESVSLKQALRGLCISQASEMAAMKRLSKPAGLSGSSEAGTIKRLYRAVVVDARESGLPFNEGKGNLVEISLVPERSTSSFSEKVPEFLQVPKAELSQQCAHACTPADATTEKVVLPIISAQNEIVPLPIEIGREKSEAELEMNGKQKSVVSLPIVDNGDQLPKLDKIVHASNQNGGKTSTTDKEQKGKLHSGSSLPSSSSGSKLSKFGSNNPHLIKPVFRSKNFVKKKVKMDSASVSRTAGSAPCKGAVNNDSDPSPSKSVHNYTLKNESKEHERASPASSGRNVSIEVSSNVVDSDVSKSGFSSNCSSRIRGVTKGDERSRSSEKGEFSQSSKSSIGQYSSSTSISEESTVSGSSQSGNRPHMSKDLRWEAIHHVQKQHETIGLRNFKLLKRLGCGDIGTVYLAELIGTNCLFALKVMDNEFLATRKKMPRAQTEREILQMLDHPFLPTLYAHFSTDKLSCLVMEYCPGGDLHVLRQKQPSRSFSEQAAR